MADPTDIDGSIAVLERWVLGKIASGNLDRGDQRAAADENSDRTVAVYQRAVEDSKARRSR